MYKCFYDMYDKKNFYPNHGLQELEIRTFYSGICAVDYLYIEAGCMLLWHTVLSSAHGTQI